MWLTASSYMTKYLRISLSPSSSMTFQPLHSEFPYIWVKKFYILFCQRNKIVIRIRRIPACVRSRCARWRWECRGKLSSIVVVQPMPEVLYELECLATLVSHETDRGLVHHLVQDHQVVILQLLRTTFTKKNIFEVVIFSYASGSEEKNRLNRILDYGSVHSSNKIARVLFEIPLYPCTYNMFLG